MALSIVFAFLAGLVTVASPCILPILPIALSAAALRGRLRPLGVIIGLVASFSIFTLAVSQLVGADRAVRDDPAPRRRRHHRPAGRRHDRAPATGSTGRAILPVARSGSKGRGLGLVGRPLDRRRARPGLGALRRPGPRRDHHAGGHQPRNLAGRRRDRRICAGGRRSAPGHRLWRPVRHAPRAGPLTPLAGHPTRLRRNHGRHGATDRLQRRRDRDCLGDFRPACRLEQPPSGLRELTGGAIAARQPAGPG